jgi:hypothetical protein
MGTILLLALALVSLWASGCTDPVAALGAINATSSVVAGHSHRCTIPLSDVNDPPPNGQDYDTTTDGTTAHFHKVHLSVGQLTSLQDRNASQAVETSVTDSHKHVFIFER